jgi:hypothetical protein
MFMSDIQATDGPLAAQFVVLGEQFSTDIEQRTSLTFLTVGQSVKAPRSEMGHIKP